MIDNKFDLGSNHLIFMGGGGGGRNLKYRRTVINAAHEKLFGAALKTLGAGTY